MNFILEAMPVPLKDDGHGGLRVAQTRVSLKSVWHLHQQGASPAEIVQAFDTLQPADVYTVVAWALLHREEVDAYLKRRDEEATQVRRELENSGLTLTRQQSAELKERLEARRQELQRQEWRAPATPTSSEVRSSLCHCENNLTRPRPCCAPIMMMFLFFAL